MQVELTVGFWSSLAVLRSRMWLDMNRFFASGTCCLIIMTEPKLLSTASLSKLPASRIFVPIDSTCLVEEESENRFDRFGKWGAGEDPARDPDRAACCGVATASLRLPSKGQADL